MRGTFITFEGGEGCGKSTQAKLLADRLRAQGRAVVLGREPGGTKLAEMIRQLFIDSADEPVSSVAQTLMMNASRDSHVRDVIEPAIERGDIMICDRFLDSTRVYQGYVAGVDAQLIETLEQATVRQFIPDITLFLDIPVETGLARAAARRGAEAADRYERQGLAYHQKLYDGYVRMVEQEPSRCVRIDASGSIDDIHAAIWRIMVLRGVAAE